MATFVLVPFDLSHSPIAVRSDLAEAFQREWDVLAAPGTWFSGSARVDVAAEARAAMELIPADRSRDDAVAGERAASRPTSTLEPGVTEAVRRVAAESPSIDAGWVAALPASGVAPTEYVEVVGIVSRLSSVDFFHRALGLPLEPLPQPVPGEPSLLPPPGGAVAGPGFVPMVPPFSVTAATSLVPPETDDWQRLSDATYMTLDEMGDPDFRRALHRTQMELVAARTSQINECFY